MAGRTEDTQAHSRLQQLGKGALLVGIAAGYALLLSLTLVLYGWRPTLLAVFFVLIGRCFRHIANEADRIGLTLSTVGGTKPHGDTAMHIRGYQRRMLRLFAAFTQLPNAALVVQAFVLAGVHWARPRPPHWRPSSCSTSSYGG